ncbi:MAG TPA: response regulator [Terriglobales bacterium]|nr:response regulator [Terriglobales bacterium]
MPKDESRRILIADNDENVLITLEHVLEDEGYATTTVVSRKEASIMLSRSTFDLLVLDDHLSDGDSRQLLTEVRGSGLAPLVVVTYHRYPTQTEETQLRSLGVTAFVNKCAHPELAAIVRYLLAPQSRGHSDGFDSIT